MPNKSANVSFDFSNQYWYGSYWNKSKLFHPRCNSAITSATGCSSWSDSAIKTCRSLGWEQCKRNVSWAVKIHQNSLRKWSNTGKGAALLTPCVDAPAFATSPQPLLVKWDVQIRWTLDPCHLFDMPIIYKTPVHWNVSHFPRVLHCFIKYYTHWWHVYIRIISYLIILAYSIIVCIWYMIVYYVHMFCMFEPPWHPMQVERIKLEQIEGLVCSMFQTCSEFRPKACQLSLRTDLAFARYQKINTGAPGKLWPLAPLASWHFVKTFRPTELCHFAF